MNPLPMLVEGDLHPEDLVAIGALQGLFSLGCIRLGRVLLLYFLRLLGRGLLLLVLTQYFIMSVQRFVGKVDVGGCAFRRNNFDFPFLSFSIRLRRG